MVRFNPPGLLGKKVIIPRYELYPSKDAYNPSI